MTTDRRNYMTPTRPNDTDPACDYLHCIHGMGQAGAGHCPSPDADWRRKDCPAFEPDTRIQTGNPFDGMDPQDKEAIADAMLEHNKPPAASQWRTDEPPKDGTLILAVFGKEPYVCVWRETLSKGMQWCVNGKSGLVYFTCDPDKWAHINLSE